MSKFTTPREVNNHMRVLGYRIRLARLRRGWAAALLAEKAGINRNTLLALEQGKLGTSVSTLFTVLWALGLSNALSNIADPDADLHGKALEAAKRPKRAGRTTQKLDYDF